LILIAVILFFVFMIDEHWPENSFDGAEEKSSFPYGRRYRDETLEQIQRFSSDYVRTLWYERRFSLGFGRLLNAVTNTRKWFSRFQNLLAIRMKEIRLVILT
jgi:hypothetical protein